MMRNNRSLWLGLVALAACAAGCDDSSSSSSSSSGDLCGGVECASNEVCNTVRNKCELPDKCGNICRDNAQCNATTGVCEEVDTCNNCAGTCTADQTCNTSTCQCEAKVCNNCDGLCTASQTCNTSTCQCEAKVCNNCDGLCTSNQTCDASSCTCVDVGSCDGIMYNGKCIAYDDNCVKSCNEEYEVCTTEGCLNKNCDGKTWDEDNCVCTITGSLLTNDREHACGEVVEATCEENADNVVVNWSFEDWNSSTSPQNWSLHVNSTAQNEVTAMRSDDAQSCSHAVRYLNDGSLVSRLESDPIAVPEKTFSGGNVKLECTAYVKGTADKINFGYRGLDENGEMVSAETNEAKKAIDYLSSGSSVYTQYSWKLSFNKSTSFQVLIGVKNSDLLLDSVECVQEENLCTGVTCDNAWEICDIANHQAEDGSYTYACIPNDGRCSILDDGTDSCTEWEKCNAETHVCEGVEGKCQDNDSCTDDTLPVCTDHTCVAGDPCDGVTCNTFRECTLASRGDCVLKAEYCQSSEDCPDDKPACYGATHKCVSVEDVYEIAQRSECLIDDDYFNAVNYVDENPKKDLLHGTLVCPVNIIPNGGFEDWVEFQFTSTSTVHTIPDWWYAMDGYHNYEIAAYYLLSEIDLDSVKPYTTASHNGETALQVINTGNAERLTSWGFKVPSGSWDCSYRVRGKGNVRLHSFSSRGDAKKVDFVSYDTNEWQRATFSLKDSASGARIVFYVGNTDASKDHIQIDDLVCTKKGDVI